MTLTGGGGSQRPGACLARARVEGKRVRVVRATPILDRSDELLTQG